MKRLFILLGLGAIGLSQAQLKIPKGTSYLTGEVSFSATKDDASNQKTNAIRILPSYGYYFADNWTVALGIGYKYSSATTASGLPAEIKNSTSAFVLNPSIRKFWVLNDKFSVFARLDVPLEFGSNRVKGPVADTKRNYTSWGVQLMPGFDYALDRHWKLTTTVGQIGYNSTHTDGVQGNKQNYNFGITLSSISFGLKYIIPAKK